MNNKKAINQLSIMIFITIITQIFMLLKGSVIASKFGVSIELDAFNFANSITTVIYSFIGTGISTILIPNLVEDYRKKSINIFITVLYSISFFLLIIMFIFRKNIIQILSASTDSYFLLTCSNIFISTLISGFLNSLLGLVNAVLQYKGEFNRLKIISLVTIIIIFLSLLLGNNVDIYYYTIVILITTIISTIVHLYLLKRSGFRYSIDFNIKEPFFRKMIILFIPTVLSTGIYQISLIIDSVISSRLGVGQISILNYSNTIIGMINILFLGNISSFMYPRLINTCRGNKCQKKLSEYIILINTLMCFVVSLFFVLGKEAIKMLYERGNFTNDNTKIVYICAIIYILALPTNAIRDLIYKYFYINNDTYTPFKNSIIVSILNISISLILSKFIGIYGIVLGTVMTSYISLLCIIIRFKKKFTFKFDKMIFIKENLKIFIIALISSFSFIFIKSMISINNIILISILFTIGIFILWIALIKLMKSIVINIKL
ncbi:lipid II flippase MurJ [Clostridium tarantellae]|uniref:Oligosaccharide flippase family protein n=1 Tax=Clostridium tarantellae TaxID=39493 RepID=A0A6I1MJU3_9CLOT|nr:lipid II flippase MurJ [Clostridium tarantellae]MPQ43655.1 hypothetical protein [Clostridium tarantellae]